MQLKDFVSITASMMNWMRAAQDKVSDFEEGSVIRTLLEAPAAEIDELYQQMFAGIREAIPVSVYRTFGFTTLDSTAAAGIIRVTIDPISTDTLIPAGTIFQQTAAGRTVQYLSTADVILPATYSTADVPVTADTPGSTGNTAPTVAFVMSPEPLAFVSAVSSAGMSGGMDGETEDARQARFREYVASLQRGTLRALEYGATLATVTNAAGVVIERVTSAAVVEAYLVDPLLYTPGLVWLYVENRVGTPSADLLSRCQAIIDGYRDGATIVPGWKAAGVKCEVRPATRTPIDVTGTLTAAPGYDAPALCAQATNAIAIYLTNLVIGEPALHAAMVSLVMAIEGVANIIIPDPAGDLIPTGTEKLAPGTITITPA